MAGTATRSEPLEICQESGVGGKVCAQLFPLRTALMAAKEMRDAATPTMRLISRF